MENLLVKASAVASILSYYQQGRRRDALCTDRSSYAEASASQSLKGRITGRISQDPAWPTVVSVSMKNFAFFSLASSPAPPSPPHLPVLAQFPGSPGPKNPEALKSGFREYPRKTSYFGEGFWKTQRAATELPGTRTCGLRSAVCGRL